eukprot:1780567-Pleurochrysis_carterae.AAC.1
MLRAEGACASWHTGARARSPEAASVRAHTRTRERLARACAHTEAGARARVRKCARATARAHAQNRAASRQARAARAPLPLLLRRLVFPALA